MKQIFYCAMILIILMAVGCGRNVKVTGKVTFPDGSPLTVGKVVFETDSFVATGPLLPDGTYTLGSIKAKDGVPPGTYRVAVAGAMQASGTQNMTSGSGNVSSTIAVTLYSPVIAKQFTSAETSGITCEVKKSMTFDFQVEPPK